MNSCAQWHHFGNKICGVDVLMGKKQFWKKDASVYSFNLRNYLLRLHVHPYFIKYLSLVYLTLCN